MSDKPKSSAASGDSNPDITDVQKMHLVLCNLQKARRPLSIIFADSDQSYGSIILESHVSTKENYFLLDELIPREGNHKAIEDSAFSISATFNGINVFFRVPHVLDAQEKDGGLLYKVAFPAKMRYQQLRNAFRVGVPGAFRTALRLVSAVRNAPIEGMLDDVSASGCRINVVGAIDPVMEPGEVFEGCSFKIPREKEPIECRAIIRRATYDAVKKITTLGIQFQDLSSKDQSRLGKLVIAIELETRRVKKQE